MDFHYQKGAVMYTEFASQPKTSPEQRAPIKKCCESKMWKGKGDDCSVWKL